jgi:rhodanese-related sulfurtransferase
MAGVINMEDAHIDGHRARELIAQGAILIDVRTVEEYRTGALPGALNMPMQTIGVQIDRYYTKGNTFVLYCKSGQRSDMATRMLRQAGYLKTYTMGGIGDW